MTIFDYHLAFFINISELPQGHIGFITYILFFTIYLDMPFFDYYSPHDFNNRLNEAKNE